MKEQFLPYNLALKLKELGFVFYPFGYYSLLEDNKIIESTFYASDDFLEAPLWQQAFDWFTRKGLHSYIEGAYPWFRYYINTDDDRHEGFKHLKIEEARQACLEKLIEIWKKK